MRRTILLVTLTVLMSLSTVFAQSSRANLTENHLKNLVTGIHSENRGLQRSSIYFAGYYKIEEVSDDLRNLMINNNNPDVQVLAALALYEIGDQQVMYDLMKIVKDTDQDMKVRKMAKAIYDTWVNDLNNGIAEVSH